MEKSYISGTFWSYQYNQQNSHIYFNLLFNYFNFKSLCFMYSSMMKYNSCVDLSSLTLYPIKASYRLYPSQLLLQPCKDLCGWGPWKWFFLLFYSFFFLLSGLGYLTFFLWVSLTFPICPASYQSNSLPATLLWMHYTL